jgi:hypothetical protein
MVFTHLFHPRPRLPLLPARFELRLGLVQRRNLVRDAHASRLTRRVQRPEPAQLLWARAVLVDAADTPLTAVDA